MIAEFTHHLWQSTLFGLAAGLLTLAFRKNRAQVRYWLWLTASLKFFVPFALLVSAGSYLETWIPAAHRIAARITTPAVSYTMEQFSQPVFPESVQPARATPGAIPLGFCRASGYLALRLSDDRDDPISELAPHSYCGARKHRD